VSTVLLVAGLLTIVIAASGLLELGTRWWARRRQGQLQIDPHVRSSLRRRISDQQRRAVEDARAREAKREG